MIQKEHFIVFRDADTFAGWPFNGGLWQFADGELLAGFVRGRCDYDDVATLNHGVVDRDNGQHVTLRSFDSGRTWPLETLQTIYTRPTIDERMLGDSPPAPDDAVYDPRADGYCLLAAFGIPPKNLDGSRNLMVTWVSTDRGHTWKTPTRVGPYGFDHLGGRPSYCMGADDTLLLFAHASRHSGERAAFPVVFGSRNGGARWSLVGEVEPQPAAPMAIMPQPLVLEDGTILIALRRQYQGQGEAHTQIYRSNDGGLSWRFFSRVNVWGAPASLTLLPDHRIVCVYGFRQPPFGIRAKVSDDDGATWGEELILRDDGGSSDLGYPRTVLRPDGQLLTLYYLSTRSDRVRHIAATLWQVP